MNQLAADLVDIESARLHQMLHHQSSKRSDQERRVRGGIDIAAYLAILHSAFDQLPHRHAKLMIGFGHLSSNLAHRTERLADQHVHRVAIARYCRSQIGLSGHRQRLQPMAPGQCGFHQLREFMLQAIGDRTYQRAFRSEAMGDESVAVARQVADFHQRGPAPALSFDQFECGIEHPLIRQLASLRLRAPPAR